MQNTICTIGFKVVYDLYPDVFILNLASIGIVENSNLNRWVGVTCQQGRGCMSTKWGPCTNQC